jgi:RNA polymerase sigma-70 factor (sigma-E family)
LLGALNGHEASAGSEPPVRRSRRDDDFTDFVAARLPTWLRVAYLLCQDSHRADDLVQVTITRLYEHWGRAAAMDHTEAYVRTILVREFLSERRSSWARRVLLGAELPERVSVRRDHDAAFDLASALAALPARQRATIVLRYYCDLTIEQTATVLGCTPSTVKSQTAKGLGSLRLVLTPASDNRPVEPAIRGRVQPRSQEGA